MPKFLFIACMLATWGLVAATATQSPVTQPPMSSAPPPDSDCDGLIYKMMDCIYYLSNDNKETNPEQSCCLGFEEIMKDNVMCLCVALKSSVDLGVSMNMTRAYALPSACGLSILIPKCQHFAALIPSPGNSPSKSSSSKNSPPSKPEEAPVLPPTADDSASPAPAPNVAGSTVASVKSTIALLFCSFLYMLA